MLGALLLSSALRCADVAELADALDSGSSGHCARAGSSPVIRSNADKVIGNDDLFHFLESGESQVIRMVFAAFYLKRMWIFRKIKKFQKNEKRC